MSIGWGAGGLGGGLGISLGGAWGRIPGGEIGKTYPPGKSGLFGRCWNRLSASCGNGGRSVVHTYS